MLSASLPLLALLSLPDVLPELSPLGALLWGLLPLIGIVTAEFIMGGLKTYFASVDRLNPLTMKLVSAGVGLIVGGLLGAIGQAATAPHASTWMPEITMGILTALGHAGLFRMFKRQASAMSGGTADASAVVNK